MNLSPVHTNVGISAPKMQVGLSLSDSIMPRWIGEVVRAYAIVSLPTAIFQVNTAILVKAPVQLMQAYLPGLVLVMAWYLGVLVQLRLVMVPQTGSATRTATLW